MADIMVMWDTTIPTAMKIKLNHPDICLRNKKTNTRLLIDISCPGVSVGSMLRPWQSTYGDFQVEISHMWQCQTQVVPMVLGALGTVHTLYHGWTLFQVTTTYSTYKKTVLLGSAKICKVKSASGICSDPL